jgi:hypothetical protein
MRAARVSAFITVAALAAGTSAQRAAPALALEPGVHIDPGSPAAKEYALPVNQARGAGGGGEGSGGSSEKLFGAGIKPPSSGSSGGRHGGRGGRGTTGVSRSAQQPVAATPAQPTAPRAVQQAAARSTSGGSASALVLFGGGVAILVLGAFTGIVLRHNRRPTSAT